MFDFYSLLELAEIRAINSALLPSAESMYRSRCRQYSIMFHTPLHVVQELDPLFVLQSLQEEKYTYKSVHEDIEGVLELLYTIKDPSYTSMSKEETENLVDAVLNKELERAARKKSVMEETYAKPAEQKPKPKPVPKPKSGSMSFGDLERSESDSESGKGNF